MLPERELSRRRIAELGTWRKMKMDPLGHPIERIRFGGMGLQYRNR